MKPLNSLSVATFFIGLPLLCCTQVVYTNSSSVAAPTITPGPVICGGCQFFYEVHGSVWWPTVYTDYVATVVYTVDEESGSTIGSELKPPTNSTAIGGGLNFSSIASVRDGIGGVQFTTLNSLPDGGKLATLIQSNEITMNGTKNGYLYSTQFVNSSVTGSPVTQCNAAWYAANPTNTSIFPGLPASTGYAYTSVIPFNSTYNMSKAIGYGLDLFASAIATHLNISDPACTFYDGGGVGTLKVGVTALTSRSTTFAKAQIVEPTSSSTSPQVPPPSPTSSTASTSSPAKPESPATTTQTSTSPPAPTLSPQQPPLTPSQETPEDPIATSSTINTSQPSSTSALAIPPTTSESSSPPESNPEQETPSTASISNPPQSNDEVKTIVRTSLGPSGLESSSDVVTLGPDSYITTVQRITTGPSGLSTYSEVVVLGTDSYITKLEIITSGASGLETISEVVTLPSDSYVTTVVKTTSGVSGLETISEATTIPIGSFILSVAGVTESPESTGTETTAFEPGETLTGVAPVEFTGSGDRLFTGDWVWAAGAIAIVFTLVAL